jgi:signal transduction histidine kinase
VLKEFSLLILRLVDLYAGFTSSEYAKERLTESYRVVKRQYGDTSIIFNILKTMPVGVLEEEKLVALNRDELEEKVKERTIELVNTNKELQIEIKERKRAEEKLRRSQTKIEQQNIQLKKADRIKTDFLNVTSHELRTPMSSIKGYTQMISKQILGQINDEQKKALDVILRNTNRLDTLIQDILDVSRLESGTMKFAVERTDVKNMILETIEIMRPYAIRKEMNITTEFEENLPELNVDKERIKQVLINILSNAIKFSANGSAIHILTKRKDEDIVFEIQDFGRGIPRNELKKVFDIFYQVDSGEDRKYGGVGLGLAISRGIILAHGGKIWVKSKMNEGSTFSFTLPIKPVQDIETRFKELDIFGLEKMETV